MINRITLIIPTHNEETVVTRALSTLEAQELGDIQLKVIVVPNGCVDKTVSIVKQFINKSTNKNITWQVEELKNGHRTKALNHGISLATTDIVMYLNPDCILHPMAVAYMYNLLETNLALNYVGMLEEPDLSFLVSGTMLCKTIQLFWCNRKVAGTHPPSGRFIAFRKSIFPKFPGFKEIDAKRSEEGKISDDERYRLIAEFCKENNIEQEFVYKLKDVIYPLVRENIQLVHQISDKGIWELVK